MRKFLAAISVFVLAFNVTHIPSAQAERIEYEYDAHGRLVKVQRCDRGHPCAGDPGDVETEYTYDQTDNRTEKEVTVHPPS